MPTIRLPEESEHGEMVKKVDAMIREISKAPAMTPTSRVPIRRGAARTDWKVAMVYFWERPAHSW